MKPTIRSATPNDAALIAWVEQTAARSGKPLGMWDLMFPGADAPRLSLIEQIVRSPHDSFAHYSGFLVAEVDGAAVGALSGYAPAQKTLEHFRRALRSVLSDNGWSDAHQKLVRTRIGPSLTCVSDTPEDCWIIEWVALQPEARGKGVAAALLAAAFERGRAAGFSKAQLSVVIGNTPAIRSYERAGFRSVDEKRHADFEAVFEAPGVARMWASL
jgi:ribosomal protein S18 acetylase RimI-like enzyme